VIADQAVSFLAEQTDAQPFFLYFTPFGPHRPTTPAPGDEGVTASTSFSTPAFNEADVSDKPPYIQERHLLNATQVQHYYDLQYAALASIDRAVGRFEAALSSEELANTMFIFSSDNGLAYGDQRWTAKEVPYERSIRVPMIVKMPGQVTPATVNRLVANVDLAPTIFNLVGITPDDPMFGSHLDGQSLLPLLTGTGTFSSRQAILLEHMYDGKTTTPSFCGVRMPTWMYAVYSDGFEELYNLVKDPYELRNAAGRNPSVIAKMRTRTQAMCDPMPPDFPTNFWATL
jgi:arylsulfatase A-like enzyme